MCLDYLEGHLRTHKGLMPYACAHVGCGKTFSLVGNMRSHLATHTATRAFSCPRPECHKKFKLMRNLEEHLATVHRKITSPMLSQQQQQQQQTVVARIPHSLGVFWGRGTPVTHQGRGIGFGGWWVYFPKLGLFSPVRLETWKDRLMNLCHHSIVQ